MRTKQFTGHLLILVSTWISLSCDCTMTPIEEHIKNTEFIVEGQVIELLDTDNERKEYNSSNPNLSYRVKFKILKCYKGGFTNDQIIRFDSDFSNCSLSFKRNGKYLLFLDNSEKESEFLQRTCSYNEKLENAGKYIKKIKKETKHKSTQLTATNIGNVFSLGRIDYGQVFICFR